MSANHWCMQIVFRANSESFSPYLVSVYPSASWRSTTWLCVKQSNTNLSLCASVCVCGPFRSLTGSRGLTKHQHDLWPRRGRKESRVPDINGAHADPQVEKELSEGGAAITLLHTYLPDMLMSPEARTSSPLQPQQQWKPTVLLDYVFKNEAHIHPF